jgi:hypothetical protein
MLNPNKILRRHFAPLQMATSSFRSKLDDHLVEKLYGVAIDTFNGKAPPVDEKIVCHALLDGQKSVTVTDVQSGLFLQLRQSEKDASPLLTFGQKFCQESWDGLRQNIATKTW